MKKRYISLGTFIPAVLLFFLAVIIAEGAISTFFRIKSQLREFSSYGETFIRAGSLILGKQVERGEEFIRNTVEGIQSRALGNPVTMIAVLDGDRVEKTLKGWLPEGMILPEEILTPAWEMNDLLDPYGGNLLTRTMTVDGRKVFAAMKLQLEELDAAGTSRILPVLSTSSGSAVWTGSAQENSGLASHVQMRGLVLRVPPGGGEWSMVSSHFGERIILRQEPFLYGLSLTLAYPVSKLLYSALYGAVFSVVAALGTLFAIFLIWMIWKRGIYRSIQEIASLADEMSTRLEDLEGGRHDRAVETMNALAVRFYSLKKSFVREMNAFTGNLRNLFRVISRQQEELAAFNRETAVMNKELEQVNSRLRMRETLWERTLDFSHTFTRSEDPRRAIESTLHRIRRDLGAYGVLLSSVEGDKYYMKAFSGYDGDLSGFVIQREEIAATESIRSRHPLWVEDVADHPTARAINPAVRSEILIPLFQAGEEEGVLEIAFDKPTKEDPFLLETLVPVASYLGGLVHGEKMRREVEASYSYMAEKLQFITGIYHDETEDHIARIGEYCRILSGAIGRSKAEQEKISLFARLHDIGKLKVPHEILCKPGPLSAEEFRIIKHHPAWGADILGDASWLSMARNICLTHHEKWDGSGYPSGMKGTEIPWEGRITAIADIYDALRSPRAYKDPLVHAHTMKIITEGDGRVKPDHFDPEVFHAFISLSDTFEAIYEGTSCG